MWNVHSRSQRARVRRGPWRQRLFIQSQPYGRIHWCTIRFRLVEMAWWLPSMAYDLGKTLVSLRCHTVKRTLLVNPYGCWPGPLYKPHTAAHSISPMECAHHCTPYGNSQTHLFIKLTIELGTSGPSEWLYWTINNQYWIININDYNDFNNLDNTIKNTDSLPKFNTFLKKLTVKNCIERN